MKLTRKIGELIEYQTLSAQKQNCRASVDNLIRE